MEKRKPTIIEFVGLHGSGKTTTAYALADELRTKGYTVKTSHDVWSEVQKLNKLKRWLLYMLSPHTITFFVRAVYNLLRGKVRVNEVAHKYQTRNIVGPMKDITLRDYIFLRLWRDVDYVIIDEGSVYVTIDLVWKYHLPFSAITTYLPACQYLLQTKLFLFEFDVELSTQRTGERNNGSFIDNLSHEERKKELASLVCYYQKTYVWLQQSELSDGVTVIDPREDINKRIKNTITLLNEQSN